MSGPRIIIRADASSTIGSGHVMRCLTLADAVRQSGADVLFVCRAHPGNLCDLIAARGHTVTSLPTGAAPEENDGSYAGWLGAGWRMDAEETGAAIAARWPEPADWLIVDHYAIDSKWETALRPRAHRVMVIDDLANRRHDCEILLDQNLVEGFENRYAGLVPEACIQLLGPEYALLGPEYAELRTTMRQRDGAVRRILIFFGSADPFGLTEKAVRAFLSLDRPDIPLDVVIGRMAPSLPAIGKLAEEHGNIVIHSDVPSLAPLMAKADLAIGAAGATSWERLCLGLPAIVVAIADNQRPIAAELARQSLVNWIGEGATVEANDFRHAIFEYINRDSCRASAAPKRPIDGRGVGRAVAALMVDNTAHLAVRSAEEGDEALLLSWANDPETRRNSFESNKISVPEHHKWFKNRLEDPDCRLYLVEACGTAIGQVRFDRKGPVWMINYSLSPIFRGRGLAARCLRAAIAELTREEQNFLILASVKPSNAASRRVFERLGFSVVAESAESIEYQGVASA